MSEKYKIRDQDKIYFVTFAVTEWVDVFTRDEYKEIVIDSLKHCQESKGLEIYSWCLMSNHIHLIKHTLILRSFQAIQDVLKMRGSFLEILNTFYLENNYE